MGKKSTLLILCLAMTKSLGAHETFSLRADIARQQGFNADGLLHHEKQGRERETFFLSRFMYGFCEYVTGELRVPVILEKKVPELSTDKVFKRSGLCKIQTRAKIRIYKKYAPGLRHQIVVVPGIAWPTNSGKTTPQEKKPILGTKSVDFLLGLAGAFETTKWYHFASIDYRLNTRARQTEEGDQFFFSYALGYRPIPPEMDKRDWVFLWEFDGMWMAKDTIKNKKDNDSGGTVIFTGPSFFSSLDNVMLKGGIQFPLLQSLNGKQDNYEYRAVFGVFIQF